jgi:hypothetical protein
VIGMGSRHVARPVTQELDVSAATRPVQHVPCVSKGPKECAMKTTHPNQPERPRDGAPDPERDDEERAQKGHRARNARRYRRLRRIAASQSADGDDAASAWYSFRRL